MKKIFITPRSFGRFNKSEADKLLADHDIMVRYNPYNRILTKEEMIENLNDVEGLIVGIDPVDEEVIKSAPKLKAIAKYGVGVDNIDLKSAQKRNIKVSITKNANSNAVADYTFALLLAVARNVVTINNNAKNGNWKKINSLDVYGKKIGIIGLGSIGKAVVERAKGFNMDVYGYDLYPNEQYLLENNITYLNVDSMIEKCDFISLHIPLTRDTQYIINKENLERAKNNLIIINTARGGLIDEKALFEALKNKKIYGAGLDAFEQEPPENSPLLGLENVVVGTHTAAGSEDATNNMTIMAAKNIIKDLED